MLRVGFVQSAPTFGDLSGNRERLLATLQTLEADLVVVPELCQSGYVFTSAGEARQLAELIPAGPTSQALLEVAARRNMTIVAGICEVDGDHLYNAAAVFGPGGHIDTYRKVHLFKEEKRWFEPGNTPFRVLDLGDVRIGVMVCYDWRFPEATRTLAIQGADIVTHPANLVLPYCQEVMRARCIENRIFAITANRVGTDARPDGRRETFTGQSQVVDPEGEVLVRASVDGIESAVVEIDPMLARRKSINEHNHLVRDRRPEFYQLLTRPNDL
jgi:predicted amidohydrolase